MSPAVPSVHSRRSASPGHTLLEVALVLVLLGAGTWSLAAGARRIADRAALDAARNEVAGVLTRARRKAILSGGAEVVITEEPSRASLWSTGALVSSTPDLRAAYGVSLEHGRSGGTLRLRWDALGLGRMTSTTLRFRRGDGTVELVISTYGRVRRP